MGQYYRIVNLDKREYIEPWTFGDGAKLMEFGASMCGAMTGLAVLLADGNGRGGGDLESERPIIGSWAGDRIVIVGDYVDPGKWMATYGFTKDELLATAQKAYTKNYQAADHVNLYHAVEYSDKFTDVSDLVIEAMSDAPWLKKELDERRRL